MAAGGLTLCGNGFVTGALMPTKKQRDKKRKQKAKTKGLNIVKKPKPKKETPVTDADVPDDAV